MTTAVFYAMLRTFCTIVNMMGWTWREQTMRDGRRGMMLFFSEDAWMFDEVTKELLPRVDN